jgi:hypothetical protein
LTGGQEIRLLTPQLRVDTLCFGATALLIINWIVVRFPYSHPGLEKIVEGLLF